MRLFFATEDRFVFHEGQTASTEVFLHCANGPELLTTTELECW